LCIEKQLDEGGGAANPRALEITHIKSNNKLYLAQQLTPDLIVPNL